MVLINDNIEREKKGFYLLSNETHALIYYINGVVLYEIRKFKLETCPVLQ